MPNNFIGQTVDSTSQAAACLTVCEDSKELLPDVFNFIVIDALARALGLDADDLLQISAGDLRTALNQAECSLGGLRQYASITEKQAQQIILYLVNANLT